MARVRFPHGPQGGLGPGLGYVPEELDTDRSFLPRVVPGDRDRVHEAAVGHLHAERVQRLHLDAVGETN